jgi:hypothetical protein
LPGARPITSWNAASAATSSSGRSPAELAPQRLDQVLVGPLRRQCRGLGLEHPAHLEQLEHRAAAEEVGREERGLEQLARLEARDIRAVAPLDLEDTGERERPNGFPERVAGQAELLCEVGFARQPRPWSPFARRDQLVNRLDRVAADPCTAAPSVPMLVRL